MIVGNPNQEINATNAIKAFGGYEYLLVFTQINATCLLASVQINAECAFGHSAGMNAFWHSPEFPPTIQLNGKTRQLNGTDDTLKFI